MAIIMFVDDWYGEILFFRALWSVDSINNLNPTTNQQKKIPMKLNPITHDWRGLLVFTGFLSCCP
jgi:hypothetical protein